MFRNSSRASLRLCQKPVTPHRIAASTGRRYLTTEPPHATSRSWKNSALRWGLAVAGIYYYNTSPLFAEYPQNNLLNPNVDALDDRREHDTLDQLTASSRNKAKRDKSVLQSAIETTSEKDAIHRQENDPDSGNLQSHLTPQEPVSEGAAELEQEAEGEGAFNPVTGEINWDCPCLGGMAYGPCGPEFREAFSCFVYSKEETKGIDCIDKFQNMQTCFRDHPEHYKDELEDNETIDAELAEEKEQLQKEIADRRAQIETRQQSEDEAALSASGRQSSKMSSTSKKMSESTADPQPEAKTTSHTPSEYSSQKESEHGAASQYVRQPKTKGTSAEAEPESESLVPKASHDATDATMGDTKSSAI